MMTKLILDICKMLLFLIFFTSLYYSQGNTGFAIFSTQEDLSHNSIIRVSLDSRYILFLGKSDGLNRNNGDQFKIFINVAGDFIIDLIN